MNPHLKIVFQYLLVCLIIFFAGGVIAQPGKLTGTVRDSVGSPVEQASVLLQNTKYVTSTDAAGNFRFDDIQAGDYSVIVTLVGFKPVLSNVTIIENQTQELSIRLNQKVGQLKEVVVFGTVSTNGMGHLNEVHDGVSYSGKKTEVIVLDKLDANTAQNNPREVLGRIPGANYSETEGGGFPANGIAFRGLRPTQSQEVQTRQNGYNIAADLYGYPESYYLPPLETVERVEVIRGASSLQFGPQFGGVINFIIKEAPKDKALEYSTQQTIGSYGFTNSFNAIGGTYKKISYYTFVQLKSAEGWRENSDFRQITGFAKIEFRPSEKFKMGLEYTLLRNKIHMAGGLSDGQFEQDPQQSYRHRNWINSPWNILALTAEYKVSERTMFTFKSALGISSRELVWKREGGPQLPDTISPVYNDYTPREVQKRIFSNSTNELRVLTNYTIKGVDQTIAAGVRFFYGEMMRYGGGPGSKGSDFDVNLYNGTWREILDFTTINCAPFVEHTFHVGKRLSVTPGFRFEYINTTSKGYVTDGGTGTIVNSDLVQYWKLPLAGIGVQLKTSTTTDIYANISESYEPVTYSNLKPLGVASEIDPNLKDVSGYNADIGWRGKVKEFLDFDIGLFYMVFNDEIGIEKRTDKYGNPYSYRTNIANSVHQGIETYIELNPFRSRIGNISFFNSYSYIDARYVEGPYKGNWEEMAPRHIDRFGINYSIKSFSTTFLMSYLSDSYADANNTILSTNSIVGLIPAYQVLDWSARIRVKNYNVRFGISNLLDTKYFTLRTDEYPGPGIIPALPRSLYLGIGAKF